MRFGRYVKRYNTRNKMIYLSFCIVLNNLFINNNNTVNRTRNAKLNITLSIFMTRNNTTYNACISNCNITLNSSYNIARILTIDLNRDDNVTLKSHSHS